MLKLIHILSFSVMFAIVNSQLQNNPYFGSQPLVTSENIDKTNMDFSENIETITKPQFAVESEVLENPNKTISSETTATDPVADLETIESLTNIPSDEDTKAEVLENDSAAVELNVNQSQDDEPKSPSSEDDVVRPEEPKEDLNTSESRVFPDRYNEPRMSKAGELQNAGAYDQMRLASNQDYSKVAPKPGGLAQDVGRIGLKQAILNTTPSPISSNILVAKSTTTIKVPVRPTMAPKPRNLPDEEIVDDDDLEPRANGAKVPSNPIFLILGTIWSSIVAGIMIY